MEGQYGHWAKLAFSASCSGFELLASSQHCCVPTKSMTMAFVELEECISIFSLYISFFFFFFFNYFFLGFHVQNSCHLDFFSWIILCLSHLCHAYMCSYVGRKFVIKILVSCFLHAHVFSMLTGVWSASRDDKCLLTKYSIRLEDKMIDLPLSFK